MEKFWDMENNIDKRQYKGYWWLPSDPKDQVAGTLTIDSRGNLKLELFGGFSLDDEGVSFERKEDPVIFGRCYAPNFQYDGCFFIRMSFSHYSQFQ